MLLLLVVCVALVRIVAAVMSWTPVVATSAPKRAVVVVVAVKNASGTSLPTAPCRSIAPVPAVNISPCTPAVVPSSIPVTVISPEVAPVVIVVVCARTTLLLSVTLPPVPCVPPPLDNPPDVLSVPPFRMTVPLASAVIDAPLPPLPVPAAPPTELSTPFAVMVMADPAAVKFIVPAFPPSPAPVDAPPFVVTLATAIEPLAVLIVTSPPSLAVPPLFAAPAVITSPPSSIFPAPVTDRTTGPDAVPVSTAEVVLMSPLTAVELMPVPALIVTAPLAPPPTVTAPMLVAARSALAPDGETRVPSPAPIDVSVTSVVSSYLIEPSFADTAVVSVWNDAFFIALVVLADRSILPPVETTFSLPFVSPIRPPVALSVMSPEAFS